jgi:tetratricopeptide (TPR) repeat protein
MAYAHARGVIHRDLKPSNFMVGSFGEVQVMDWGLAKVLSSGGVADESRAIDRREQVSVIRTLRTGSDADASQAGSVMGTPAYMPPEQAGGDVEALDERADVFALGAILCEILSGSPPYIGQDGDAVFRKALRGDLADAMARLDACGADPELVDLAKSCLAPELLDRPRDARIVAERLTDHLAGVQERLRTAELARAKEAARATEAVRKARAERQARRLAAGLAAAVFAAIALGGGGISWFVTARSARRAAAVRDADELLGRVTLLRAKARAAPAGALIPWDEALAEARRAADQARELADPPFAGRIAEIAAELKQGRKTAGIQAERLEIDRKLLSELESIRANRAEHFDPNRTEAEYAAAFRNAGLDLDATESQPAGDWIAARSAPLELAAFLDDWAFVRHMAGKGESAWRRLVAAARAADKDRWRDALRAGLGDQSPEAREALRKLACDEEALGSQPAESLRLLARLLKEAGDREAAAQVLRRAWRQRPDDFWVNFELARAFGAEAGSSSGELFPHPEEGVRYLTAALAVRPGSAMAQNYLAIALSAQGKNDEAVAEWHTAIRLRPDFATAQNGLGAFLRHQGKLDLAIARFREAIRLKPDYALAHNNLGAVLSVQGKLDEAIAECRAAIRLKPDHALAHYNLGDALRDQGKLQEAVAAYREAIRLKPDDAAAHNNLGNTLARQGKLQEAIAAFREAIRLDPHYVAAHNNLGNTLARQGRLEEAIAAFHEAIRFQPENAIAHENLGLALKVQGKLEEAIAEYRAAIRLKPELAQAHSNLGIALRRQGKLDEAIAECHAAIRLDPNDAAAHIGLGNALRAQGKLGEAIDEYRAAVGLQPDYALAHYNLGDSLSAQGKPDEAIAAYRAAIRLQPDYTDALHDLGNALARQGRLEAAVATFREAIRLEPGDAVPHINLGNALRGQGKLDQAVAAYHQAIRLKPDLAVAHDNLGLALSAQGKTEEAVAAHRQAIRLKPDFALAHNNLGLVLSAQGKLEEALAELRAARDHAGPNPEKRLPGVGLRIAALERQSRLLDRLPRLLKGQDQPASSAEGIDFATLCSRKGLHGAAARLYVAALKVDPKLCADRRAQHAYNAACAAVLAGCGQGHDDPLPDEAARAGLRKQALEWLTAELVIWGRILDTNDPKARESVVQTLQHWKVDTDLAGVRDRDALAKLPEAERAAWQAHWAEVDRLLERAKGGKP